MRYTKRTATRRKGEITRRINERDAGGGGNDGGRLKEEGAKSTQS
jgi:hypothetical protein